MAPELIRVDDRHGTQAGDVYSFAIICSELLNRETAWDNAEDEDDVDGKSLKFFIYGKFFSTFHFIFQK